MQLPGGLYRSLTAESKAKYHLVTDVVLWPVNGELEMRLADRDIQQPVPAQVTDVLTAAVQSIGSEVVTRTMIEELCVADRQYLIRYLECQLYDCDNIWLNSHCHSCQALFDFSVSLNELPITPSADGFPFVIVMLSTGEATFRVPNGADQQWLEQQLMNSAENPEGTSEGIVENALLQRCWVSGVEPQWPLSQTDKGIIDDQLSVISPAVITELNASCPECHSDNGVALDPYRLLHRSHNAIFDEVHWLASHYHWSERDILSMSRSRRQRYLQRLHAERSS